MRKLNQKNGITIISLIVTVIIMLILAGVTITMLKEDKIVDYAEKAVGDTQNAIDQEHELINKVGGYLKNKTSGNSGTGTTPGEDSKIPEGLKVGDYVNYTPSNGTYTVASGENGSGYASEQSFTTETGENTLQWRVWSIDEEKGTVELISATAAQTSGLYLQGADGYNHGVDILNDLCKALYSNTNGATARSINVEDINAKTTYDYTTEVYTLGSFSVKYGDKKRLSSDGVEYMNYPNLYSQEKGYGTANKFNETGLNGSEGLKDGVTDKNGVTSYSTVKGYTNGNTEGTDPYVTHTYYGNNGSTYTYYPEGCLNTNLGINILPTGLINIGVDYWLASRCVRVGTGGVDFDVDIMKSNGYVGNNSPFGSGNRVTSLNYLVRPIVSLGSNASFTKDKTNTTESVTYWDIEY